MIYAGIGSRETPPDVRRLMRRYAYYQAYFGEGRLRTGGATGADDAFCQGSLEAGVPSDIFIPVEGYNGLSGACPGVHAGVSQEALILAHKYHPAWDRCSVVARKLHARNGYIVLGLDLETPVDQVVCWTPNGSGSGGTGQALRIARDYNIPILDLGVYGDDLTAVAGALSRSMHTGGI
jgi:hypothetical protein